MSTYREAVLANRDDYPFDLWRERFDDGLAQYSEENCARAREIMDNLLEALVAAGEDAETAAKEALFKTAVEAFNDLNEELDYELIETGEREELWELFNDVTVSVGLNPEDYADGEGIVSMWRDW